MLFFRISKAGGVHLAKAKTKQERIKKAGEHHKQTRTRAENSAGHGYNQNANTCEPLHVIGAGNGGALFFHF